jgi:acetylglutamate kinase
MPAPTTLEPWDGDRATLRAATNGLTVVVKLGGSVGGEDTLPDDVAVLQKLGASVVLVHGGGPLITQWTGRLGLEARFVDGLRYTDAETLHVVRMVLSGLVNGGIVARLGAAGVRAIGLSGSDDGLLRAIPRDPRLGLVGDVSAVNPSPLELVLRSGYAAVVAPVAVDGRGQFLNVNADTAAAEIAVAISASNMIYLTDVPGISDGTSPAPVGRLTAKRARALMRDRVIAGGMIPKVEGGLRALSQTGQAHIVDGRRPHCLLDVLTGRAGIGTTVVPD